MRNYFLICVIFVSTILFSINLKKPFIGHHDFNSAFFSTISRNLVSYPIGQTKLGQIMNSSKVSPRNFQYYTHNVPLFTWIIALSFLIFGVGDWQARLVSILFSTGSVVAIYLIAKKLLSIFYAAVTSLLLATSAMFIYFSSSVFPEPQAIFFSLLAFYFYIIWLKDKKHFFWLIFTATAALLTVWGPYFLILPVAIHYLIFSKSKSFPKFLILIFLPIIIFIFFLLHVFILTGNPFTDLAQSFLTRTNIEKGNSIYSPSPLFFIRRELSITFAYYSKLTVLLSFFWLLLFIIKFFKKQNLYPHHFILPLLLWGILYPLVFTDAAYNHDYFLIYLAPFFALAPVALIYAVLQKVKSQKYRLLIKIIVISLPLVQFLQILPFANVLLKSSASEDGYVLGTFLKGNTEPNKKVLVLSGQFGAHLGVFTNYYAAQDIAYHDFSLPEFEEKNIASQYNYIVFVEGRDTPAQVKDYLKTRYDWKTFSKFTVFEKP